MKFRYLFYLTIVIFIPIWSVFAHDDETPHDEDDNSDLVFLGVFVLLIILAFVVSSYYGKKTKEKLYGKSSD